MRSTTGKEGNCILRTPFFGVKDEENERRDRKEESGATLDFGARIRESRERT
jgi:hypothetical protein